jgi:hypothetical protein
MAQASQVATPVIFDEGYQPGQPMPVYMTCSTSGATIFYKVSTQSCPGNPTHNGSTPTNGTLKYDPSNVPEVPVGVTKYFKALGYKSGMTDSAVSACYAADNVQQ